MQEITFIKNLPTTLIISIISYILIITLSYALSYLNNSNILIDYNKHSLIVAITQYKQYIIIWGVMGIVFIYLQCGGYDRYIQQLMNDDNCCGNGSVYNQQNYDTIRKSMKKTIKNKQQSIKVQNQYSRWHIFLQQKFSIIWQQRSLISCIIITLSYAHSYYTITSSLDSHNALYKSFKFGNNHSTKQNHYQTNYDISWPGYHYYYLDNYYYQTKQRLEHQRAKLIPFQQYQQILQALNDLNNGIYSIRTWLVNHRFGYQMLKIGWGNLCGIFIVVIWGLWIQKVTVERVDGRKCLGRIGKFAIFILAWINILTIGFLGEIIKGLLNLNKHQLCLPQPNSGVISIIINSNSISLISSLKLNIIEDPNQIYQNICNNMQQYYQKPLQTDSNILIYTLNVWMIAMIWIFIGEIFCMMNNRNVKQWISKYKKMENGKANKTTEYLSVSDSQ